MSRLKWIAIASMAAGLVVGFGVYVASQSASPAQAASRTSPLTLPPPSLRFCQQTMLPDGSGYTPMVVLPGASPLEAKVCSEIDATRPHPRWGPPAGAVEGPKGWTLNGKLLTLDQDLAHNPDGSLALFWANGEPANGPNAVTAPPSMTANFPVPPPVAPGLPAGGINCRGTGLTAAETAICNAGGAPSQAIP